MDGGAVARQVRGAVPGAKNGIVVVRKAVKVRKG